MPFVRSILSQLTRGLIGVFGMAFFRTLGHKTGTNPSHLAMAARRSHGELTRPMLPVERHEV